MALAMEASESESGDQAVPPILSPVELLSKKQQLCGLKEAMNQKRWMAPGVSL